MTPEPTSGTPVPEVTADGGTAGIAHLIETLKAQGVKAARVSHGDLYGKCRSKELPIDELELATEG